MDRLSAKEQKFVDLVAIGTGYQEAAKLAGYSERSAHTLASRLLKKVEISDAIRNRQIYFRTLADVQAKEVIGAQAEIAFASIEDALDDDGRLDFSKAKENGAAKLIKKITRQQTKYGESVSVV
jgi:phage terminase small subunit